MSHRDPLMYRLDERLYVQALTVATDQYKSMLIAIDYR